MKNRFIWVIFVFQVIFAFAALAADEVVVAGKPPITMKAVNCHMRLIEFVIGTRLTVEQKNAFLEAIKTEGTQMTEQDKNGFLSALELADSMDQMEPAGHEAVKFVLKKDFEDTARGLPGDPAADLYLKLMNESSQAALTIGENVITKQSLAAFIEYLEFLANPDNPVKFSDDKVEQIKNLIKSSYDKLGEENQATLDDFQLTWYMIRAGYQNIPDKARKEAWKKELSALGVSATGNFDLHLLKKCLAAELYADILDEAARLGAQPDEWIVGYTLDVW
ncbi:MAG: hypothetical protein Kow0029_20230 [Candidatus Rifleibacteriota bacterium]